MKKIKQWILNIDKSIFLLLSIIAFVFIFPIIDNSMLHDFFVTLSYTLVLLSIFSIVEKKTKALSYLIVVSIVANIVMLFADENLIEITAFLISMITFIFASVILIRHVAINKKVTSKVIIQAISGYLLIGVIGVLLNAIMLNFNENAIKFSEVGNRFSSVVYYSFITLTTIGYGDVLPQSVIARSISMCIGVSGQLYLTIVIALIIGKFLSGKQK